MVFISKLRNGTLVIALILIQSAVAFIPSQTVLNNHAFLARSNHESPTVLNMGLMDAFKNAFSNDEVSKSFCILYRNYQYIVSRACIT